jgi:hypothetical protein
LASSFEKTKPKKSVQVFQIRKQSFLDKDVSLDSESFSRYARFKTIGCLFEKYILDNDIDTIVTSGPPHSLHLIGLELKQN